MRTMNCKGGVRAARNVMALRRGFGALIYGRRQRPKFCVRLRRWTFNIGRWTFSSASVPERIHPLPDDPVDQLRIGQSRLARRLGEVFVFGQNRIWICLNEINFVGRRQSQVDTRVAINSEQTVDALTCFFDAGDQRRLETDGELVLQAPAFAIFFVPLRAISRNLRLVRRYLAENQLADRKNL